jgi:4-hydroxy-3-methylbut-2-enyl diphosphate reductase
MQVLVAEKCGFCLGVKNAIRMAKETLARKQEVYSLGPVIHNE